MLTPSASPSKNSRQSCICVFGVLQLLLEVGAFFPQPGGIKNHRGLSKPKENMQFLYRQEIVLSCFSCEKIPKLRPTCMVTGCGRCAMGQGEDLATPFVAHPYRSTLGPWVGPSNDQSKRSIAKRPSEVKSLATFI